MTSRNNTTMRPSLIILEQPQHTYRFRYKSECGNHGCIGSKGLKKAHPTVELVNFSSEAIIKCSLVQAKSNDEHPHRIAHTDGEDVSCSVEVGKKKGYIAEFKMGIIHTAKKDVPKELINRTDKNLTDQERQEIIAQSKLIDLNIVRLKFSAYDMLTAKEMCCVYSDPVYSPKSAETNELRIVRMSRARGSMAGGDDVFIFVEKVRKNNIQINFTQYDTKDCDKIIWQAKANFVENDVHHQYAIAFRTPKYTHEPDTKREVPVHIQLYRPTDQALSNAMPWIYTPDPRKRSRNGSSYSSVSSSASSTNNFFYDEVPLKSEDMPVPVLANEKTFSAMSIDDDTSGMILEAKSVPLQSYKFNNIGVMENNLLGDALYDEAGPTVSPLLAQPNVPQPPEPIVLPEEPFSSSYINHLLAINEHEMKSDEYRRFEFEFGDSDDMKEYMRLIPDSGPKTGEHKDQSSRQEEQDPPKPQVGSTYTASYTTYDGIRAKSLVQELGSMLKRKLTEASKKLAIQKLEELLDLRLNNGDTFLHMCVANDLVSTMVYLVKTIKAIGAPKSLLDRQNNSGHTLLHLAVMHGFPDLVTLLIESGCDPLLVDVGGHDAVHLAAINQSCLAELTAAMAEAGHTDLNRYNCTQETALMLCVRHDWAEGARLLLERDAAPLAADGEGRTALHLAACDHRLAVMRALLPHVKPKDVNMVDRRGLTALQLVCGSRSVEPHKQMAMARLLLENGADPDCHSPGTKSPRDLASKNLKLKSLLMQYGDMNSELLEKEDDDSYESAREE